MNEAEQTPRALVLVAVAVVLGALVLALGFDTGATPEADAGPPTPIPAPTATVDPNATPTAVPTATPEPTPTPDPDYRQPNEVKVLVANGTDIPGRASGGADSLIGQHGYNALPVNVDRDVNQLPDAIFHLDSYDANAREIAATLGIDPAVIAPMPSDPPVANLDDAHIVVVLGLIPPTPTPEPTDG